MTMRTTFIVSFVISTPLSTEHEIERVGPPRFLGVHLRRQIVVEIVEPLLRSISYGEAPKYTYGIVDPLALAADHGDAEGDGFGIVGHKLALKNVTETTHK